MWRYYLLVLYLDRLLFADDLNGVNLFLRFLERVNEGLNGCGQVQLAIVIAQHLNAFHISTNTDTSGLH